MNAWDAAYLAGTGWRYKWGSIRPPSPSDFPAGSRPEANIASASTPVGSVKPKSSIDESIISSMTSFNQKMSVG